MRIVQHGGRWDVVEAGILLESCEDKMSAVKVAL